MTIVITAVSKFKKLNDDPSYQRKPGGIGREREVVVDVVITASTTYTTGGITLDFSGVGINFTQVYLAEVKQGNGGFLTSFVPATGDAASTGKLLIYGIDEGAVGGAVEGLSEIANASALVQGLTLRMVIRGI